ncbi:(2Fe-2S)-binding protein [Amycolatopsis alkalitolerans]|uniref:(2Fe-2S)-binding protein n=1 Tax=Amycolatopsis alkalitolerans TaxID=2547244 RepID=A0A5C4LVE7_9PSEU|nr:(2Fe-2S)-binding protein [Amycolatopsis alkalitolerans]TNC22506.1 (2Fe-2S)-binding protein [Amycolatopsis alkalitolerans]
MTAVPATSITDPAWLRTQIGLAARRYGCARPAVLGTIWWYSASSVLVAPTVEALAKGQAVDPSLPAITLDVTDDGRLLDAHAARPPAGELGPAMSEALESAIATIEQVTGARAPALRAIATDSIANRLLWAGAPELAEPLLASIGGLPKPRYFDVGPAKVVHRASCCLIYQVGQPKCVSCPRQRPAERARRLRAAVTGT